MVNVGILFTASVTVNFHNIYYNMQRVFQMIAPQTESDCNRSYKLKYDEMIKWWDYCNWKDDEYFY